MKIENVWEWILGLWKWVFAMFFAIVFAAEALVSCTDDKPAASQLNFDREIFNQERQLWTEQDIQNYSFWQNFDVGESGGIGTKTIIVKDGDARYYRDHLYDPVSGESCEGPLYLANGDGKTLQFNSPLLYISVSELYAQIEQFAEQFENAAFTESPETSGVHGIEIQYDDKYHFPVRVHYSYKSYQSASSPLPPGGSPYSSHSELYISKFVIDPEIPEE